MCFAFFFKGMLFTFVFLLIVLSTYTITHVQSPNSAQIQAHPVRGGVGLVLHLSSVREALSVEGHSTLLSRNHRAVTSSH